MKWEEVDREQSRQLDERKLDLISVIWPVLCTNLKNVFFFFILWGGTLGTAAATGLLYQPRMINDGDCEEIVGIKFGRGNRSTRKKTCPSPTLSTSNPT
jgi:hypothetical protein